MHVRDDEQGGPDRGSGPHPARGREAHGDRRVGAPSCSIPTARPGSSPSATSWTLSARARTPTPSARRPPHLRHRLRRARLVARGGRGRHGPGRLPPLVVTTGEVSACSRCATSCAAGPRTARSATCRSARRSARRLSRGRYLRRRPSPSAAMRGQQLLIEEGVSGGRAPGLRGARTVPDYRRKTEGNPGQFAVGLPGRATARDTLPR